MRPLDVSVILPLTDDRGQGRACLEGWLRAQRFDRTRFEVIVIANGSVPQLERGAHSLLGSQDSLVYHDSSNAFLLYNVGARRARGRLLFLTEAHCVPDPDCLEKIVHHFATQPDVGARCRSVGANIDTSVLTRLEHRLFEESFAQALQPGHWLKVLVHGFGIYRDAYLAAGGLEHEFGQFAEWALAARLHNRGIRVGYAPNATMRHYYLGHLHEAFRFIRDFTHGELLYRTRNPAGYCERYFGRAGEWAQRASYRTSPARALCRAVVRTGSNGLWPPRLATYGYRQAVALSRWGPTALLGIRWHLWKARQALAMTRLRVWWWRSDDERGYRAYRDHWAAIIRYCRLEFLATYPPSATPAPPDCWRYELARVEEDRLVGFYEPESWNGQEFRWSEPAALLEVSIAPGSYEVTLGVLTGGRVRRDAQPTVFFDGHKTRAYSADVSGRSVSFRVDPSMFDSAAALHHLVVVSPPRRPTWYGSSGARLLGLPLHTVEFRPA